jgi:putative inorganic carbon (hco3(-)) transporter
MPPSLTVDALPACASKTLQCLTSGLAMRDVMLVSIVTVVAVIAVVRPWIGVMGWTVVSIMNPHRYSWDAADFPLAAVIAVAILLGLLVTRDRRASPFSAPNVALLAFMAWICVALPFSFSVQDSMEMWNKVMKIDLMIIVATIVLTTRTHVMALVWVLVGSIGLYGFKGGIFTILHGGTQRVWGPPSSFIEGNNELALALVMTIPLMRFLQLHTPSRAIFHALTALMLLSAAAALGTQSRGALLALSAMAGMLFLRSGSGQRIWFGLSVLVAAAALIAFMPSTWDDRMATILDYEKDSSALGRINAWWMAWNLATSRFTGGGFAIYDVATFTRYAPNPQDVHAAHSIYFQVLGEHGFVGLALFLLMWFLVWRRAGSLRRLAGDSPELRWAGDLGSLIQVSLAGFAVGGAFLSLAYFDLPYNLLVLVVVMHRLVMETRASQGTPHAHERVPVVAIASLPHASRGSATAPVASHRPERV